MAASDTLPFATLETCFRLLCVEPGALAIHGCCLGGRFSRRWVPLDEVSRYLYLLPPEACRRILGAVLARAQLGGSAWQVGLAGLVLPCLRFLADRRSGPSRADAEADALAWLRCTVALPPESALRRLGWLVEITGSGSAWPEENRARRSLGIPQSLSLGLEIKPS